MVLLEAVNVTQILTDALPVIKDAVIGAWEIVSSTPLGLFFIGATVAGIGFGFLSRASQGV